MLYEFSSHYTNLRWLCTSLTGLLHQSLEWLHQVMTFRETRWATGKCSWHTCEASWPSPIHHGKRPWVNLRRFFVLYKYTGGEKQPDTDHCSPTKMQIYPKNLLIPHFWDGPTLRKPAKIWARNMGAMEVTCRKINPSISLRTFPPNWYSCTASCLGASMQWLL